jgi:hypothetical protein
MAAALNLVAALAVGGCMATVPLAKVDPAVQREMTAGEGDAATRRVPVILQIATSEGASADPATRARGQEEALAAVRQTLVALGAAGQGEWLALASGLAIELTPAQIRGIAADPRVKRVVSNRPRRVVD